MPTFDLTEVAPGQVIKAAQVKAALLGQTAVNTVTYSATPTFNAALGGTQAITLTGNVTSSTLTNTIDGQKVKFRIVQDSTGGRSFAWPTNVKGGMTIDSSIPANAVCIQEFETVGATLYPASVGAIYEE